MSIIRKEGKNTIIFATREDHATPSKVKLPEPEPSPGLLLPNGEINWNCPCLGGMATGPCGVEFREAFSCFHSSTSEPKGSECFEAFKTMQSCMVKYPSIYNKDPEIEEIEKEEEEELAKNESLKEMSNKKVNSNPASQTVSSNEKEVVKAS
ncbi:mitochondrial intermembrane space import and assembly protein 40-B isoform X1 [Copidosoma floridanum]|uniref:mitochondrial intermembrane space import and assembly protein 40-B isoform X1 n=1 Tax=Copidosoma floridanum TaxID=29053 RepID=UPI0006C9E607|nr:mitochondrial intermembrane space import and assembly protein 40-B isoform X1 [Copidosoma floridanum]XP_014205939.1 mitochondrial intermembrane space import and assembly protein 40-B isoform X1 [Copidosoma floridanum]